MIFNQTHLKNECQGSIIEYRQYMGLKMIHIPLKKHAKDKQDNGHSWTIRLSIVWDSCGKNGRSEASGKDQNLPKQ